MDNQIQTILKTSIQPQGFSRPECFSFLNSRILPDFEGLWQPCHDSTVFSNPLG